MYKYTYLIYPKKGAAIPQKSIFQISISTEPSLLDTSPKIIPVTLRAKEHKF